MRTIRVAAVALAAALVAGCAGGTKNFDGPTVDAFNGKVVAGGQPVKFPAGEEVLLELFHQKGESFKIPISTEGTFNIGWMPVGKYSATLLREQKRAKATVPGRHSVPGGLTVAEGQTSYTIDLGKDFKP